MLRDNSVIFVTPWGLIGSESAIAANIEIACTFVQLRRLLASETLEICELHSVYQHAAALMIIQINIVTLMANIAMQLLGANCPSYIFVYNDYRPTSGSENRFAGAARVES
jgi:hypothetical protein